MFRSLTVYDADTSRTAKFKRFGALINVVQFIASVPYTQWSPYYLSPKSSRIDSRSGALVTYQPVVRWDTPGTKAASLPSIPHSENLYDGTEHDQNLEAKSPEDQVDGLVHATGVEILVDKKNCVTNIPHSSGVAGPRKRARTSSMSSGKAANPPKRAVGNPKPSNGGAKRVINRTNKENNTARVIQAPQLKPRKIAPIRDAQKTEKNTIKGLTPAEAPAIITTNHAAAGFAIRNKRRLSRAAGSK